MSEDLQNKKRAHFIRRFRIALAAAKPRKPLKERLLLSVSRKALIVGGRR